MTGELPPEAEQRLNAGIALIGRTGAQVFQLRYSDDEEPTIWMAVSQHGDHYETAAAMDPVRAVLRLAEALIDGGTCTHCGRPAGLEPDHSEDMPLDNLFCWYQYDPELKTYRRGCEGD
jgi:hypothetical protein